MGITTERCTARIVCGLEKKIRERCLHRVVKNDGAEMDRLLKDVCSATQVRQSADFMFRMETKWLKGVAVFAEPTDSSQKYLRIIGYRINLEEE